MGRKRRRRAAIAGLAAAWIGAAAAQAAPLGEPAPRAPLPLARFERIERALVRGLERCDRRAAELARRGRRASAQACIERVRRQRTRRLRRAGLAESAGTAASTAGRGEASGRAAPVADTAPVAGAAPVAPPTCDAAPPGGAAVVPEVSLDPSGRSGAPDDAGTVASITLRNRSGVWPGAEVPYELAPDLPAALRDAVAAAVAHWNANTLLRLRPRAPGEPDYLLFREYVGFPRVGSSYLGRIHGAQTVLLGRQVPAGVAVHEIGHAVGLLHEQSRPDRDEHVLVHWENIDPAYRYAFEKVDPSYGVARGPYDFGSIMHYWDGAFSRNGQPTLTRRDGSPLGWQGDVLSDLDIAGYTRLQVASAAQVVLESPSSRRCLDVAPRIARGVRSVARPCRDSVRQRWRRWVDPHSGGTLLVNQRSGMCLTVPGGSRASGVRPIQTPCHGGKSQHFAVASGASAASVRSEANGLCLEVAAAAEGAAARVVQAPCSGSPAQVWLVRGPRRSGSAARVGTEASPRR